MTWSEAFTWTLQRVGEVLFMPVHLQALVWERRVVVPSEALQPAIQEFYTRVLWETCLCGADGPLAPWRVLLAPAHRPILVQEGVCGLAALCAGGPVVAVLYQAWLAKICLRPAAGPGAPAGEAVPVRVLG